MDGLTELLDRRLFAIHDIDVTMLSVLFFLVTLLVVVVTGRLVRSALIRVMLRRPQGASEGSAYAVGRIAQYAITVAGVFLALENLFTRCAHALASTSRATSTTRPRRC
jgi:small-conductance mechanosensitive channel